MIQNAKKHNDGLQLRRAISIRAEGKKLLEKHAIAPSAARLCWVACALMKIFDSARLNRKPCPIFLVAEHFRRFEDLHFRVNPVAKGADRLRANHFAAFINEPDR